jgi:hypothetical protein
MRTVEKRDFSRRWVSRDGRLVLCKSHVEPIVRQLGNSKWSEITPDELSGVQSVLGYEMPCDFCEMEIEAKALLSETVGYNGE